MDTANTINQQTSNPATVPNYPKTGTGATKTMTPDTGTDVHEGNGVTGLVGNAYTNTKQFITDGYTKTTEFLGHTAEGAINLGKRNPGKMALVTFGLGIGTGVLLVKAFTPKPKRRRWLLW